MRRQKRPRIKNKADRKKLSKVWTVIWFGLAGMLFYMFLFEGNSLIHTIALKNEVETLESSNDSLRAANIEKAKLNQLLEEGDHRAHEKIARDQNMSRKGEIVVHVDRGSGED